MIRNLICFCLVILASCGGKDKVPDHILSQDKVTEILIDVYVTEAKIDGLVPRLPRDSAVSAFHILQDTIIKRHNTTDSVFRESMRWYFQNPEKLDVIYSRVIDSLNLKLQQNRVPGEQAQ